MYGEFDSAVKFYSSTSEFITLDGRQRKSLENLSTKLAELLAAGSLNQSEKLLFTPCSDERLNLKCYLVSQYLGIPLKTHSNSPSLCRFPRLVDNNCNDRMIIGANSICKYISMKYKASMSVSASSSSSSSSSSGNINVILDIEEVEIYPLISSYFNALSINASDMDCLMSHLEYLDTRCVEITSDPLIAIVLYPTLAYALEILRRNNTVSTFLNLSNLIESLSSSLLIKNNSNNKPISSIKAAAKVEKISKVNNISQQPSTVVNTDWSEVGLLAAIRQIFSAAIVAAFPQVIGQPDEVAVITRCGNPTHGDFQCNNAMGIAKFLKTFPGYTGTTKSPRDIADAIVRSMIPTAFIENSSPAPNGFINIRISSTSVIKSLSQIVQSGVKPLKVEPLKVLVDFSSPNIAKEMHVGHLRSTIIGDSICRILEFCGHEVLRVNHVGDWGTQFGMLITYLQEEYPDILINPPNISDLTAIYKASKKRFDENETFKETARLNVVKLQSFDPACIAIWTLLCNISRAEFQKVYDLLGVTLTEMGESFYNPIIPSTIIELQQAGLVEESEGMLIIRQEKYEIPLILRKSDGGYGYDSTDMTALSYRLKDLKRDWIIVVTDAGQATHFHMCFDAGRKMNWITNQRVDHIGFGVVQGEDGKRFKTRSSETVRLIDLLDAAKDRMYESLLARSQEGKTPLQGDELIAASKVIGYGAVKYFDLKQHPTTNYIFSYDRMLDVKGDTAVYLLFAYARVASILRKAEEEKGIILTSLFNDATTLLTLEHPAERALAFELMQFGDAIRSVLTELLPNRLCDFLKEICVKFTDFVTKCHVLNAPETKSRLILCESTRRVMTKCFELLGIGTLERI